MTNAIELDTKTIEELIERIEAAGFDWAVGRYKGKFYGSAVERAPREYIGDDMSGPGCEGGDTPYEALNNAFLAATK